MKDEIAGAQAALSKVPQVAFAFWIIKICATTLGETAGDAMSMTLNLGYAVSTAIFFGIFAVTVAAQVRATRYIPWLYWLVIVATTTAGTTLSDCLTRTAGLGYLKSSLLLFAMVDWHFAYDPLLGRVHFDPAPGRHAWRSVNQTAQRRRPELEPDFFVGGYRRRDGCGDSGHLAKSRESPRRF